MSIEGFREKCGQALSLMMEFGKKIESFDRSGQTFGETTETQLRGRAKMITNQLLCFAIGSLIAAFGICQYITHPGLGSYFLMGFGGLGAVIGLKEAALQHVSREAEKKANGITEETDEMRYGFGDLFKEMHSNYLKDLQLFREKLFGSQNEEPLTMEEPTPPQE